MEDYRPATKANPFRGLNGAPMFKPEYVDHTYAKAQWSIATRYKDEHGNINPSATTIFKEFKPKDSDTAQEKDRKRPFYLGYLTKARFNKWCLTAEGSAVTGIDCTKKAGACEGQREGDIRRVCNLLFELCVAYSKHCEGQEADYERVQAARKLSDDGFTTYQGFAACIHSGEFKLYKQEWVAMGLPVYVPDTAPAPAPAPAPEPKKRKKRTKTVVEMDGSESSGDELMNASSMYTSPKQSPAPSPTPEQPADHVDQVMAPEPQATPVPAPVASKPKKPKKPKVEHARKRNPSARGSETSDQTAHWPPGCLGDVIIKSFEETKLRARSNTFVFNSKNTYDGDVFSGGYALVIKKRTQGKSGAGGQIDGYVILSGMAKERNGGFQLRSLKDIARHFNANSDLNLMPGEYLVARAPVQ